MLKSTTVTFEEIPPSVTGKSFAVKNNSFVLTTVLRPQSFAQALASLPRKELEKLITLMGQPPKSSKDRGRQSLSEKLSKYVRNIELKIEWVSQGPNRKD